MPSAFAHVAVGASVSAFLPAKGRPVWVVLGLGLLAAAPDLDVLAFRVGIPYAHPLGHRGLTHSLPFAALVGSVSYVLLRSAKVERAGLLALLASVSVASHGVLDTFTDAGHGVGLLIPFENGRYFAPWRPIATSPLSIRAFFSDSGASVLANEVIWIGVPCTLFCLAASAARKVGEGRR